MVGRSAPCFASHGLVEVDSVLDEMLHNRKAILRLFAAVIMSGGGPAVGISQPLFDRRREHVVFERLSKNGLRAIWNIRDGQLINHISLQGFPETIVTCLKTPNDGFGDSFLNDPGQVGVECPIIVA